MKTFLIASASAIVSGGVCYIAGEWRQGNRVVKKMNELQPLLVTMVTELIYQAADAQMTPEEIKAYAETQLEFIKIVTK